MPCTVVWDSDTRDDLATIWLGAPNQQAVADAADEIDRLLAASPLDVGEVLALIDC